MDFEKIFGNGNINPKLLVQPREYQHQYTVSSFVLETKFPILARIYAHLKCMEQCLYSVLKVWILREKNKTTEYIRDALEKMQTSLQKVIKMNSKETEPTKAECMSFILSIPHQLGYNNCFRMPYGKTTEACEKELVQRSKNQFDSEYTALMNLVS